MKCARLLILLLLPCRLNAGCIGAIPVINTAVSVGKETILPAGDSTQPFYIMNGGDAPISVRIAPIAADPALLFKGYEQAPSCMKFTIFDSQVLLKPAEVKKVSASIYIPRSRQYLGKNYQYHVSFTSLSSGCTGQASVNPGFESVVLITTAKDMAKVSCSLEMSPLGGDIGQDEAVRLSIPAGAINRALSINIQEIGHSDIPVMMSGGQYRDAISAFKFYPEGTMFKKPVRLSIYYPDFDDDGMVDGTGVKVEELKVFYWDGFTWEAVGGILDTKNKCVTADVYHFSVYGLFPAGLMTQADFIPKQKIITPAKLDGHNDYIVFPNLQGNYSIDIYDVRGMKVVRLENKNIWYGLDNNGIMVESGAYIYKYNVDIDGKKKTITGVVVVAK